MDTQLAPADRELTVELLEVLMTRHEKVTESVRLMAFDAPGRAYTPEEEQRIARAQNALIRFNDILDDYFDNLEQRYDQHHSPTNPAGL